LAPLLLGHAPPEPIAETLAFVVTTDAHMRLVISSDLSHFYHYEQARALDEALIEAVISGDFNAVEQGEACGRIPILILMHLGRRLGWQAHLLDYRNSGDTAGDRRRVVGYAAIAFTEPTS